MTKEQTNSWEDRFEKFMQDFMYELKTDNSYYQLEHKMYNFIEQIISERDKELLEKVDETVLDWATDIRFNRNGDDTLYSEDIKEVREKIAKLIK